MSNYLGKYSMFGIAEELDGECDNLNHLRGNKKVNTEERLNRGKGIKESKK